MPGLRSLTLSAGLCRERRKLVKPKTARSRRSLFVEVSQGRGGAVLFPFSPPPPSLLARRRSFSLVRLPLPFVLLLLPTRTFALYLSFSSFSLERRSRPSLPALRSFRITRLPFFSSHSVLVFLSASRSFLLLVSSSSCSHDSLYETASSACNYCRYVLSTSSLWTFAFSHILHFSLSRSQGVFFFNFVNIFFYRERKCFWNFFKLVICRLSLQALLCCHIIYIFFFPDFLLLHDSCSSPRLLRSLDLLSMEFLVSAYLPFIPVISLSSRAALLSLYPVSPSPSFPSAFFPGRGNHYILRDTSRRL